MSNREEVLNLLTSIDNYQVDLSEQSKAIAIVKRFLAFLIECVKFAEKYLPIEMVENWAESNKSIPLIAERIYPVFKHQSDNPLWTLNAVATTAGSASSDGFAFITGAYNFLETNEARDEFIGIAGKYKSILFQEEAQQTVNEFLAPIDPQAAKKYTSAVNQLSTLPPGEDPEGALVTMRSALNLTLNALLKKSGLTKAERKLKQVEVIPKLAAILSKDITSQLDLLLISDQFMELNRRLSAAKDIKLDRDVAEGLALQATSILNQLARTIDQSKLKEQE